MLSGKVVLVHFWSYASLTSIEMLPVLARLANRYGEAGLVVVGVHAPMFDFERSASNLEAAVRRLAIRYPVAQDRGFATWSAYRVQYWPSSYLVDRSGKLAFRQDGAGEPADLENAVRAALGQAGGGESPGRSPDASRSTPSTLYLGLSRLRPLASPERPGLPSRAFTVRETLPPGGLALAGVWKFTDESTTLDREPGAIEFRFVGRKACLVAASASPAELAVSVDGHPQPPVTVAEGRLYPVFETDRDGEHRVRIEIGKAGLVAYALAVD